MFKESIIMSWQNIIHNKMRSFLTILGVIIGVASIIALITIVSGVTESVTTTVSDMGANTITVRAMGTPLKQGLSNSDVEAIATISNVDGVSPAISGKASIVYDNSVMEDITVQGKNDVYFAKNDDLVENGRPINSLDVENKNRVCLIGQDIVNEFFPTESPINKEIVINGITHFVIGTLKETVAFSNESNDTAVYIPYTTAKELLSVAYISTVEIYMTDGELSDETTSEIKTVLHTAFNYNDDGFSVTNMQSILDRVAEMTGMMSAMLTGIASIALIVGGIGIMNMMLVSVTERTTEIGLRKALGAEPKRIQQQFLIEAVFLSGFGGVIGLIVGIVIAFIGCLAIGTSFVLSTSSLILGITFSVAIGVIFGLAPAKKASRLNPIDALRSV